jgi:hypothetical protein
MSINIDQIKQKLKQIQSTASTGGSNSEIIWKPPVGKSQVRIVPYAHDKSNPFIELYFHFEIGKKTMLSPHSFGRPDPIMEFAEKLKKSGNKDDWRLGKKIEPKFRVYVPVIVRGQESEGVKFWSFGKQIYQELLGYIADPDYGDITDLMNGRDITIDHIAAEKEGAFPSYTVRIKPNATPATQDKAIAELIVNGQKNITDIVKEPSYEDMTTALEAWLNPGSESAAPKNAPIKGATTAKKVDDISDAFSELFNS